MINSRLDTEKKRSMDINIYKQKLSKGQRKNLKNEKNISELWHDSKWPNVCVIEVPKGEKEKNI